MFSSQTFKRLIKQCILSHRDHQSIMHIERVTLQLSLIPIANLFKRILTTFKFTC